MSPLLWFLVLLYFSTVGTSPVTSQNAPQEQAVWNSAAQRELTEALAIHQNLGVAKNVILFLGDGMGISTVNAARIFKGQREGKKGEETLLNFEKFPFVAMSKTYNADRQTPASSSTATAVVGGVKTNFGTVGFDSRVTRGNCSLVGDPTVRVTTMLDWAMMEGKSVGVVTNTRLTHATPAAVYAHSPERNWEKDTDGMECVPDIARQLLEDNANITVMLGGGRRSFINRRDGKDLVQDWLDTKNSERKRASYARNVRELRNVNVQTTDHLLGLFTESHMTWELNRDDDAEPSLEEMTEKAVQMLRKNDQGFFLFVEGGRIDHAHHDNWAKRALAETVALDEAVTAAVDMTDQEDTLIVVTADHSHPFNIVGYPSRGNDILGKVDIIDPGQEPLDDKPYTTLVYANGPGPSRTQDLTGVNTSSEDFQYQVIVPFQSGWETHSGEDVGIYAKGPMAHLFHGVHEQNYIAHVMAYASCVGPNKGHCTDPTPDTTPDTTPETTPDTTPDPDPQGNDCTGGAAGWGGRRIGGAVIWVLVVLGVF